MKGTARVLLLILPFHFIACSADGGPSGALVGLLTGGVLGAVGDELTNDDEEDSSDFFGGNGNNNNNNGSNNNGTGSGTVTTITGTGSKTDTNGDGVIDENDASTGTTTTVINGGNNNGNDDDDIFEKHGGLITGAIAGAAAGAITDSFRKKEIQKKYDEGYAKAKSDAIKEFYWLKRDAQKTMKDNEPPVQYRYYEVEVPAHTTSDGVLIDKHRRVIEVVE